MGFENENVGSYGCSCRTGTTTPSLELRLPQPDVTCHQRPNTKSVQCQTQISFPNDSLKPSSISLPILPRSKRCTVAHNLRTQNAGNQVTSSEDISAIQTRLMLPVKNCVNKKTRKMTPGKVVKKYRKSRMHRVKKEEYKKLREMVPSLQEKNNVSKVVVIEETVKYIDELHSALIQRFRAKGLPLTFNGVQLEPREIHDGNIRELVRRMLANANPNSLPPSKIENVRTMPSFLQKLARPKKF